MESVGNLADAERKVLGDARALLLELGRAGSADPQSAEEAVGVLSQLRDAIYENLNQIQHEYMILAAIRYLVDQSAVTGNTEWQWNPRQTGGKDEPDLRGTSGTTIVISAEVTTSKRPVGTIVDRMEDTLRKLAGTQFRGEKYYFVRTKSMEKRALGIVQRDSHEITVVRLAHISEDL